MFSNSNPGPDGMIWQSRSPGTGLHVEQVDLVSQDLVGLAVPVREEHGVDGCHDRAFEPGHEVDPVQAALDVLLEVVGGVGDVLRPHERHCAVDHEQLAVVAQVGPLVLALERLHRQHEVPLGAHGVEPLEGLLVEGLAAVGPVVQQHPHGDAARRDLLECAEEVVRRFVRLQDVELDVHVAIGLADGVGHRVETLLVVRDQVRRIVSGERHRAEVAVERHHRGEPVGGVRAQRAEVEVLARVVDVGVDLLLHAAAFARKARIADQQEEEDPDEGDEVDRQQPGHGRRRAAVARHDDDRGDADRDVGDEDEDQPPRRVERDA